MNIYTLDPRCIPAMEKVREYYLSIPEWQKDVREGKMFGVLIYSPTNEGPVGPSPLPLHKGGEYNVLLMGHKSVVTTPFPCGGAGGRVRWGPSGVGSKINTPNIFPSRTSFCHSGMER